MCFALFLVFAAACNESGGYWAPGSLMPGAECIGRLLPGSGTNEVIVLEPGASDLQVRDITFPQIVSGGTLVAIPEESGVSFSGHFEAELCPDDFDPGTTCVNVLCPICEEADGCPI
mgnify:CR=1 FL=1